MATEHSGQRPIDRVLAVLQAAGKRPRASGDGFVAQCPAHNDTRPSLSVGEGSDHRVIVSCHTGCTYEQVVAALGLTVSDLFEPRGQDAPALTGGTVAKSRIVATYDYRDEIGALVYQVCRLQPKEFRQRRPDPETGEWTWKVVGVQRLLYRLPELNAAGPDVPVYFYEGERDVETAEKLGLLATTTSGGTDGKIDGIDFSVLKGRTVVIVPDYDKPGFKYAGKVADALSKAGAKVLRVNLYDGPLPIKHGKDFSDWVAEGHTATDLQELLVQREQPGILADGAPFVPEIVDADTLLATEFPPIQWLVEGVLQRGAGAMLIGPPKVGKSKLALSIAVAASLGGYALGTLPVEPCEVLYLALEDGPRRLKGRIAALTDGVKVPRLRTATKWAPMKEGGEDALRAFLTNHPDTGLIVVDTFARVRSSDQSRSSAYTVDYAAVAPFNDIAQEYNCSVLIVHHSRKGAGSQDDDVEAASGTSGTTAPLDAILRMQRNRRDSTGTLSIVNRDAPDASYAIQHDDVTGGWIVIGTAEDAKLSDERNAILEEFENGETSTPQQVSTRLKKEYTSVRRTMYRMAADGQLENIGNSRFRNSFQGKTRHSQSLQSPVTAVTHAHLRDSSDFGRASDSSDSSDSSDWSDSSDRVWPIPSDEQIRRQIRARNVIRIYRDHGLELTLNAEGQVRAYGVGSVPPDLEAEAVELDAEVADELRERGAK